jgi:polysaccharide export outer membrane protein
MKRLIKLLSFIIALAALSSTTEAQEAKFRTGQTVNLSVAGVPAEDIAIVSKPYTISESGKLNLPYIGELSAAGYSRSQLEKRIEQAYMSAQIYTRPTVTIIVDTATTGNRVVTVTGEVRGPGPVPYREGIRLLDAIASAGGFTDFGSPTNVIVMRGNSKAEYNLRKVSSDPKQNAALKPDDTIIVRQRKLFGN